MTIGASDLEVDGVPLDDAPASESFETAVEVVTVEYPYPFEVVPPLELGYILLAVSMLIGCFCAFAFIRGTKL